MYARVVANRIQAGKMDEWLALIRDCIVPALNEQNGFGGFVVLAGREHDKSIGYSMWAGEADLAASESSGRYRQQIGKLGAVLAAPPVRDAYELMVVAWP